jgi:hypothetical protein
MTPADSAPTGDGCAIPLLDFESLMTVTFSRQRLARRRRFAPCDRFWARPDKNEPNGPRYSSFGAPVPAHEQQSRSIIAQAEINHFATVEGDGSHRDVEKFTARLIKIVQA